ncbi:M28 family metallopeptidase [Halobacteriovorax sp. CON-3]|uniref:M28 family metallopeptidase n=1 Tax=Halobacteriovorax sp. CON-3 TaxID=3157710 RepID=UPI00371B7BCE
MKYLIIALSMSLSVTAKEFKNFKDTYKLSKSKRSPKKLRSLYYAVSKNSEKDIGALINSFVKETRPNRFVGTSGHKTAQDYIVSYIESNVRKNNTSLKTVKFVPDIEYAKELFRKDLAASKDKLSAANLKKWQRLTNERIQQVDGLKSTNGYNIVWEKKGIKNPNEIIVVGAHYDTAAYDLKNFKVVNKGRQPGADNNASGVVAALSLINILAELDLEKTVRVVFFDYGENGFLGSYDYVKNLNLEKGIRVYSYVELVMLGYDTMTQDKEQQLGNMKLYYSPASSGLHKAEKSIAQRFYAKSSEGTFRVEFKVSPYDFVYGDNTSFQKFNIPSVVFTQNWESDSNAARIHTPADHVNSLNIKTLHHATNNIAMSIASWALDL